MATGASHDWLLLRGLVREALHWGDFVTLLARACPDDRITCLDLPGAGAFVQERAPFSVPATMEWLRAHAPGRPARRILVGMSLGGMVALEWALRHRDECAGLVLINSSAGGLSPFWQRARLSAIAPLLRIGLGRRGRARERAVLALTSSRRESHPAWAERHADLDRARPITLATGVRQLVAAARYRPRLPKGGRGDLPVLVLSAGADALVDPRCSRRLAAALAAPLETHPDAGHDLALDDPDWTAGQLARWRQALAPTAAVEARAGRPQL